MKIRTVNENINESTTSKKVIDPENIFFRISNLLKENDYDIVGSKLKKIEEMEKELIEKELGLTNLINRSIKIESETKHLLSQLRSENIVIRKKLIEMLGE